MDPLIWSKLPIDLYNCINEFLIMRFIKKLKRIISKVKYRPPHRHKYFHMMIPYDHEYPHMRHYESSTHKYYLCNEYRLSYLIRKYKDTVVIFEKIFDYKYHIRMTIHFKNCHIFRINHAQY
jgi:hypothetical protein